MTDECKAQIKEAEENLARVKADGKASVEQAKKAAKRAEKAAEAELKRVKEECND